MKGRYKRLKSSCIESNIYKRQAIEALRFGLVPESYIKELTIGFDEISLWVNICLDKCQFGIPACFEVSGPYGMGKSHTLNLVRHIAKERGFLTVHAEVDGQNVSLSNPAMLLYSLWSTLPENGIDPEYPLLSIYQKVANSGFIPSNIICMENDRIVNNLKSISKLMRIGMLDEHAYLIDALLSSSNEITARQLIDFLRSKLNNGISSIKFNNAIGRQVDCRPFDFIESLAGNALLMKLAGYKGLIVTIDEFEVEYNNKENLARTREMLNALKMYLDGKTKYFKAPLGIFFATVYQGGIKGDSNIENLAVDEISRYRLKPWNKFYQIQLAKKIHSLYCDTYALDYKFDNTLANRLDELLSTKIKNNDSQHIRAFIKWYVALLDIIYGPSGDKND